MVTLLGQGPRNWSHPGAGKEVSRPEVNAVSLKAAFSDHPDWAVEAKGARQTL